ncbi:MAG: hypothetical protein H0T89_19555 [Deltaproteobacteria bacterium]|nr:hypothetical protein [Deltaproteobacteria bacterium]
MKGKRSWGGARIGAGRPTTRTRASEPHTARPAIDAHQPVHVTARIVDALADATSARTRLAIERALHRALDRSLDRVDFRIVQLGHRGASVVLIVEARDRLALARGMQGFQVSAARYLNAATRRRGPVFPDRYRAAALTTRRAVRHALARARWLVRYTPESRLLRGP